MRETITGASFLSLIDAACADCGWSSEGLTKTEIEADRLYNDVGFLTDLIGDRSHGYENRDEILEWLFDHGHRAIQEAVLRILDRESVCPNCGEVLCDRVCCLEDGDEAEHFAKLHRANDDEDRELDALVSEAVDRVLVMSQGSNRDCLDE